ncbi:MAG: response regulator [Chloroflexota bacterium]
MDESTLPTGVNPPVKILVVDDHPNTASMLARVISRLGSHVAVISATSGSEALKLVESSKAEILITDMNMPEMTGLELIEKLNNQPATCPAFTFLMTAYDTSELSERLQQLKVKEVITKPVNPERICQIVSQALEEMKQPKSVTAEPVLDKANPLESVIENKTEEQGNAVTVEIEMEKPVQVK